jgi:hypothetical protein
VIKRLTKKIVFKIPNLPVNLANELKYKESIYQQKISKLKNDNMLLKKTNNKLQSDVYKFNH